ncbi:MAG: 50S ribosomal protein L25 [Phycisphaerae bacterium]|nr:50S ribosomal protein L25 [Phycisphaerae bacterium]MBM91188.1 50S ribosomal protein L25 [Phycisphaerae bacterium]HCT46377.1 50S ribosomal protein L25 [Phycisphaerales bacterium]
MSDTTTMLSAQKRERTGSRYAQRVRNAGGLPAVVYGHKEEPVSITLDAHTAIGLISKGEKVFELDIEGAKQHVLLKDLGYDYLGTNIIHADFARVDLNERVDTKAHLRFVGEAKGLKTSGAIMMHPHTEVELNVLISNLPDHIDVDVSEMEVGDVIHASDVQLPLDSMKLLTDPETIVAQIVLKAVQEEEGEAGEVAADGAEPQVISEKKEGAE